MNVKCEYDKISFDEILKNIDKYAKEFSENNELLEQALKLLWNNGYETIGCCSGHDNNKAYIGLKINNTDKIIKLLSSLDKTNIQISFLRFEDKFNCSIKKYNDEDIFENIINSYNENLIDDEIKNTIKKLKEYASDEYLNIHYYYTDNKLTNIFINTTNLELINEYKELYEYKVFNGKPDMYQFRIK